MTISIEKILCTSSNSDINSVLNDLENCEIKTIGVLNQNLVFIGTITDGDIRRALLKKDKKLLTAEDICNKNFFYVKNDNQSSEAKKIIRDNNIDCIPIIKEELINDNFYIKAFVRRNFNELKSLEKKFVGYIFAGGRGSRMGDLTKEIPKPLLKINNKPLIDHVIEEFIHYEIREIYVSTGYLSEKIENYLMHYNNQEVRFHILKENNPLGTAGSLSQTSNLNKILICRNADVISPINIRNMMISHLKNKSDFTIGSLVHNYDIPFGVIEHKGSNFEKIIEKPTNFWHICAGINVISSDMCAYIKPGEYIDMPTFINRLSRNKKRVNLFPIYENWRDIGTQEALNYMNQ